MLVPIDEIVHLEIDGLSKKPFSPRQLTPDLVQSKLETAVQNLSLGKVLLPKHILKISLVLKFDKHPLVKHDWKPKILLQNGGELIFILSSVYHDTPDTELAALFKSVTPHLTYKRKSSHRESKDDPYKVWVYVEMEPPTRALPDYGILPLAGREGWPERFRQPVGLPPLWSCF